jgi:propionyl-CoA carboxylase alpha chain
MPGLVVEVPAKKGDRVFRGQNLVVLESMKMESGVPSPVDGVIAEVLVAVGQPVEAGDVMVRFAKNETGTGNPKGGAHGPVRKNIQGQAG